MSLHKDVKFPALTPSRKQRFTRGSSPRTGTVLMTDGEHDGVNHASNQTCATRRSCCKGSSYFYRGPGRKPLLLVQLEDFVNKELQTISPNEPEFQELKLQVYRNVFGCFIRAFTTYGPLLSAIKKEYENSLEIYQDKIREVEQLRSHLRLVTEECDRKIQARWKEEQTEIASLKKKKEQLQNDIKAGKEREMTTQAVVDHLQAELSSLYLQYREERDSRKLLIRQLNDLSSGPGKKKNPADENTGDTEQQQLALKVCQRDLTTAQEELNKMKTEYWDVVPRQEWDALEHNHKQTLFQLKTLQVDFNQLKTEYDTLLELQKRDTMQAKTDASPTEQVHQSLPQGQSQIQSNHIEGVLRTAKSSEETDEHVASVQSETDSSRDTASSQRNQPSAHSIEGLECDT